MNIALITYPIEKTPAGVGVHVRNIVKSILELDNENTYYLLHFTKNSNEIYRDNEILYKHYKYLPVMFSDSWYLYNNSHRFDIIHRFSPGGFIFKVKSKIVITVHDLFLYESYPFNRKLRIYLARHFNRSSIMKADAIIAVSEFTKQKVLKTFHVREDRIHVVYGAPNEFIPTYGDGKEVLRSSYGIDGSFILFVSTIEPRKNLLGLVRAYEILKEKYSVPESLVVVGQKGWDYEKTMKYIENSKVRNSIIITGFVPNAQLPYFYSNASLFVYPSFMEGFGIPPLEAMSCGCPTLTSSTSSLSEIVKHPEMMFNPEDVSEIIEKVVRVLKEPSCREDNIRKGVENAKRFSWNKSAEQIISIYQGL